jgi:hypothetical protein
LVWQNILLQTQIRQQAANTLIVRRAQLLHTIYTTKCEPAGQEEVCRPVANPRAVREAVIAFVEIERGRGTVADLISAELFGADLGGANLAGAEFFDANLSRADLRSADLTEAVLFGGTLAGANLTGANLTRATLAGTDLRGANLIDADLTGVLSLGEDDLNVTYGDERTILPAGVKTPDHWGKAREEQRSAIGTRLRLLEEGMKITSEAPPQTDERGSLASLER